MRAKRRFCDRKGTGPIKKTKKSLRGYLLSLLLTTSVAGLYLSGGLEKVGFISYDFHFFLRGSRPSDPRIVIVAQDDESVEWYKVRISDWPRSWHARLIENLNRQGAEIIVFDYDFSKPTTTDEDHTFARAIRKASNVVLANRILSSGEVVHPLPAFADGALDEGFINFRPDRDGHWRRILYMAVGKNRYIYFSLPLKVVEIYEDFPEDQRVLNSEDFLGWGSHQLPYPDMLINFAGAEGSFPVLSYKDVMEERVDRKLVEGKIVLVGNTHSLGKDFFSTPTSFRMPGVEVYAHAVATIMNDAYIFTFFRGGTVVFIFVLGLAGGWIFFHSRTTVRMNLFIAGTALSFLILTGYYLFVHHHLWLDMVPLVIVVATNAGAGGLYQWAITHKREYMVKEIFGRYVSQNVVNIILSEDIPIQLDGHKAEVTVIFSDIRGFTNLSERLTPAEVGEFLNHYFEEMIRMVFIHEGTLDKLMGDAVMAFFGAPIFFADHPIKACRCALRMVSTLERLKKENMIKGIEEINIGVGLNTGEVIVGNLGSSQYIDYTVIGDTVNLGARLEKLNKEYQTNIIISEFTYQRVKEEFKCRELDLVTVRGKSKPIKIYELIEEKEKRQEDKYTLDV